MGTQLNQLGRNQQEYFEKCTTSSAPSPTAPVIATAQELVTVIREAHEFLSTLIASLEPVRAASQEKGNSAGSPSALPSCPLDEQLYSSVRGVRDLIARMEVLKNELRVW